MVNMPIQILPQLYGSIHLFDQGTMAYLAPHIKLS